MMYRIGVGILLAGTLGCASSPSKKIVNKKATEYTKNLQVKSVDSKKYTCPKDLSKVDKKNWKSMVAKASSCAAKGHFSKVETLGDWLSVHHHLGPWGPYFLSLVAEKNKAYDRAEWLVDLGLKKAPNEGLLIFQKARLAWYRNNYAGAVTLTEQALNDRPDIEEAHYLLATVYYRDQEFQKAKKHFAKVVEMNSKSGDAWTGLAECEIEAGNGEAALKALSKAMSQKKDKFALQMRMAFIYENVIKDPAKALSAYKRLKRIGKSKLSQQALAALTEKIQVIENQLAKAAPGEKVSQRKPAKQGGVNQ